VKNGYGWQGVSGAGDSSHANLANHTLDQETTTVTSASLLLSVFSAVFTSICQKDASLESA
jgi:hypothetical protein